MEGNGIQEELITDRDKNQGIIIPVFYSHIVSSLQINLGSEPERSDCLHLLDIFKPYLAFIGSPYIRLRYDWPNNQMIICKIQVVKKRK